VADKAIPGLAAATVLREVATPVTNYRYTLNARGSWAGYEATPQNVGPGALGASTPIPNLFQVGAWSGRAGQTGALASGAESAAQVGAYLSGAVAESA
jgi:phytoene dehydrogenase-like protein